MMILLTNVGFAQQDCFDAISVCTNSYTQTTSYTGTGSVDEVPVGSSCLGNGEANSVWYTFTATSSGNLEFQLNPVSAGDDYDFALYNLSTDSCSGIELGTSSPVSCNYSADPGPTGLSAGGSGNNNGASGSNQNAPLAVQSGESFALLISNFTASQSGYELNFSGSASIIDNSAGTIDSVSLLGLCNPNRVLLYLSDVIDCSSIAGDGSDFVITGPGAVTITSVTGASCSGGATELWVNFSDNLPAAGNYTLTLTTGSDGTSIADGCGNEMAVGTQVSFSVEQVGPELTVTNIVSSDCAVSNGSATAVASGTAQPFTYNWNSSPSQNTPTASNLAPGVYRIEVTDTNGCSVREIVTIDNNNPLDVSNTSSTPTSCNGVADGTAQIVPAGGTGNFTIEWQTNPVQTGQDATGLPAGGVDVIVTDDSGCEEEVTIYIQQPPPINVPITIVNPDCGVANGSATVAPTGGNGNFSFLWNSTPPQTTASATGLAAGVYSVTVTDDQGCQRTGSAILADNFAPNATIQDQVPDCNQQGLGQATALATSGTAPYTYSWSTNPPQTTATAVGLTEGDYFVTITDAANCVQIINVKIDTIETPELTGLLTQPSCGQSDGEISVNVTYGVQPFDFAWSSSANNTNVESNLPEGTYSVTLTDAIGCTVSESFELNQLPPTSSITTTNACVGNASSFSFTTTSGATSWVWDFGDGNTSTDAAPTHTYATPGNYPVSVSLSGGCLPDQANGTVDVYEQPVADFIFDPSVPTTQDLITFSYTGNGGTNFVWDFADGNTSTDANPQHQYEVEGFYDIALQATNADGCSHDTVVTVEVLLAPAVYFPNAFIPDGVLNTHFKGQGIGVVEEELQVFDRWGTLIYSHKGTQRELLSVQGWDGTYKGKPLHQGAYPFKAKVKFYTGVEFEKYGTVTLIR